MITEERIKQFNREFPEVVAANLANICVWLEKDIEISEQDILKMMKRVEGFLYNKTLGILSRDL